jgi:pyruvate/2-oxoglutarate dehydrogenase complex dihydrolipoamide acyltransferase (E2) component
VTEIRIPKLGIGMTEATLAEWLAADGAHLSAGTPLYALEMDKSTNEVEAPTAGTLTILAAAGETYPVGHLVARIA